MRRFSRFSKGLLALALASAANAQTFTYQGALRDAGAPASGAYDMQFVLFDAASGGNQVGDSITQNDVGVAEGLFISELNFGPAAFNGADRWIEISVNGTPLSPRSNVTPAPMAIFAMKPWETSGTSIFYSAGNVGIGTNNPATMFDVAGMVTMSGFTLPTGAGSARVLTSDAAGVGVWSALPGGLGGSDNIVSGVASVVPGGQANRAEGIAAAVGGGDRNVAGADSATVGGGSLNNASAGLATIGGGQSNSANAYAASVVGGFANEATGVVSTVGGGEMNSAGGNASTVGGGELNEASQQSATVAGGQENTASGITAAVGGGFGNTASGQAATVGGGHANNAGEQSATVGGGQDNSADGAAATVGGGQRNEASAQTATVAGGQENTANGIVAAVGGGFGNSASEQAATVGGGQVNTASDQAATVAGGFLNTADGPAATIPGGIQNTASGLASFAAGNRAKALHNGAFVWADSTDADFASTNANQFLIRAAGGVRLGAGTFLDFGFGVVEREVNAGKIGYALFTPDALDIVGAGTTGPTRKIKIFAEGGTTFTGNINVNGTNYTSDRRYKTNIVTFPAALDAILDLRGVTFDWDRQQWTDRGFAEGQQIGFIAQEVEEVLPELVNTDANGYKSVAYANLVPVLVEAVKTLKQQNDATKRENEELKLRNEELKSRLEVLEQAVQQLASQPK